MSKISSSPRYVAVVNGLFRTALYCSITDGSNAADTSWVTQFELLCRVQATFAAMYPHDGPICPIWILTHDEWCDLVQKDQIWSNPKIKLYTNILPYVPTPINWEWKSKKFRDPPKHTIFWLFGFLFAWNCKPCQIYKLAKCKVGLSLPKSDICSLVDIFGQKVPCHSASCWAYLMKMFS